MSARLDIFMADTGLCESREKAQRLIMAGVVRVNGQKAAKPSQKVEPDAVIELEKEAPYVSRGGLKLEKALRQFCISLDGKTTLDIGASTGGFTDCMLQNGATKVYAVDVGYGQLHWKLRNDPRVVVMEKTNARHLLPSLFDTKPQFTSVDTSFISIKQVLPAAFLCMESDAQCVALIKPQFEAPAALLRKGVVRDANAHIGVLEDMLAWFDEQGLGLLHLDFSPITGPKGNIEFLAHLHKGQGNPAPDIPAMVRKAHVVTAGTNRNML